MTKHSMPAAKEGNVNVTPLIDVVMCLIIFYMLVARIGVDDGVRADIAAQLPEAGVAAPIADLMNTINLNVEAGPRGETLVTALDPADGQMRQFEPVELVRFLRRLKAGNPQIKAIILAKKDTRYDVLQGVLIACAQANLKEYDFKANKPREAP